jgi:hypothetical protein
MVHDVAANDAPEDNQQSNDDEHEIFPASQVPGMIAFDLVIEVSEGTAGNWTVSRRVG